MPRAPNARRVEKKHQPKFQNKLRYTNNHTLQFAESFAAELLIWRCRCLACCMQRGIAERWEDGRKWNLNDRTDQLKSKNERTSQKSFKGVALSRLENEWVTASNGSAASMASMAKSAMTQTSLVNMGPRMRPKLVYQLYNKLYQLYNNQQGR